MDTGSTDSLDTVVIDTITEDMLVARAHTASSEFWKRLMLSPHLETLDKGTLGRCAAHIPQDVWVYILFEIYEDCPRGLCFKPYIPRGYIREYSQRGRYRQCMDRGGRDRSWVASNEFLLLHARYITDDDTWARVCRMRSTSITPKFVKTYTDRLSDDFWHAVTYRIDPECKYPCCRAPYALSLKLLAKYMHMFGSCTWMTIFLFRTDVDIAFLRKAAQHFDRRCWRGVCEDRPDLMTPEIILEHAASLDSRCWEMLAPEISKLPESFLEKIVPYINVHCWDDILSYENVDRLSEKFIRDNLDAFDNRNCEKILVCYGRRLSQELLDKVKVISTRRR